MILVVHLGEVKDRKDRMEIHCFPDTGKCEIHDWFPNGESAGISKCSITRLRELMHSAIAESREGSMGEPPPLPLPQPPKETT